jgi:hypothetical protein
MIDAMPVPRYPVVSQRFDRITKCAVLAKFELLARTLPALQATTYIEQCPQITHGAVRLRIFRSDSNLGGRLLTGLINSDGICRTIPPLLFSKVEDVGVCVPDRI